MDKKTITKKIENNRDLIDRALNTDLDLGFSKENGK